VCMCVHVCVRVRVRVRVHVHVHVRVRVRVRLCAFACSLSQRSPASLFPLPHSSTPSGTANASQDTRACVRPLAVPSEIRFLANPKP